MMRFYHVWLSFVAAFMLAASPAFGNDPAIAEGEKAQLQLALNRGLDIYRYDQAAWHITDTMMKDVKDPWATGIRGWVVTKVEDGHLATFWAPDGDGFRGVYSGVWTGSQAIRRKLLTREESVLSSEQVDLIRAVNRVRQEAEAGNLQRCGSKPFNAVALPPEKSGDPVQVYFLTPQTTFASLPLGGHYRFAIKDGTIVEQRGFTKSCLELPLDGGAKDKGKPAGLMMTHLLDPVPTEIHIFSVLAGRVPLYVATIENNALWVVEISGGQPRARKLK